MNCRFVCITIFVLCFVISSVLSAELTLPQGKMFTTLTPSVKTSPTSGLSDSGSEYADLKTTTVPSTQDSKTAVIRYSNENLPDTIKGLIDHIDFQTTKDKNDQVFIYFKLPAPDASINQSEKVGHFIINRKEWIGDRSLDSVSAEIYIHWVADNAQPLFTTNPVNEGLYEQYIIGINDKRPSPVYPTHLGYNYAGLDKTNLMDQFLLTL